jgi:hypothetical protein
VGAPGRPPRFRLLSGEEPDALISRLQQLPEQEARGWLGRIEGLGELLDAQWEVRAEPQFLSEHDDELRAIERGYGETTLATAWRETTNQEMTASIMVGRRPAVLQAGRRWLAAAEPAVWR